MFSLKTFFGSHIFRNAILACALVTILVALTTSANVLVAGEKPINLLYFTASSDVGSKAFEGTVAMIVLGALLHLLVSYLWVIVFFWAFSVVDWLAGNWKLSILLIGTTIWAVMFFIVIPLSLAPHVPFDLRKAIVDVLLLSLAAGIPISYLAMRSFKDR